MSDFTDSVSRGLRGVHFFSPGAMIGCDQCGLADQECSDCEGSGEIEGEGGCATCGGTGEITASEEQRQWAEEGNFSWRGCDVCGSSLGGTRFPAHGVVADSIEEARVKEPTHFDICVDCLTYTANGEEPAE